MSNWYVIYTNPGQEFMASNELKKQNFKIYAPIIKRVVRHARKMREEARPFFPRYIFVYLNTLQDQWKKINYTRGVKNILTTGEDPAKVPDEIINELRLLENKKGLIKHIQLKSFEKGDKVEILSGPLKGKYGLFDGLNDNSRVRVLLDFMGKSLKVSLYKEWVDKA